MVNKQRLSVVITSYTLERLGDIYELLDSIKVQKYPDIEIVFVAERSKELLDKTRAYAEKIGINNFNAVFNDGMQGQSPARNFGIKHAKGDIVAFVDDDVVLFPDWAEEMVKSYNDDSIIGVTGPGLPLWENDSLLWLPEELYWIVSCTAFVPWKDARPVRTAWGMNMSFRKEAFEYCLFSEDYGHIAKNRRKVGPVVDDAQFSINLRLKTGKVILFNPVVKVKHRVYAYRLERKFTRGQAFWQGYSKALLKKTYSDDKDTRSLSREKDLLGRILFKLVPTSVAGLFRNPRLSLKRLSFTTVVLFNVALGYASFVLPWPGKLTIKSFKS